LIKTHYNLSDILNFLITFSHPNVCDFGDTYSILFGTYRGLFIVCHMFQVIFSG